MRRCVWLGRQSIPLTRRPRLAELTTGVLCVCFPEIGVLFKKSTWSRKKVSTAVLEGRYRHEDAMFQGPSKLTRFTASVSHGTLSGTTRKSIIPNNGDNQFELDEMNLIEGRGRGESREGAPKPLQPPEDAVEVIREVSVVSSSMV